MVKDHKVNHLLRELPKINSSQLRKIFILACTLADLFTEVLFSVTFMNQYI